MNRNGSGVSQSPRYRPVDFNTYSSIDEGTEGCARILQAIFAVTSTAAMIFMFLAVSNCEFLYFYIPNSVILASNNSTMFQLLNPDESTRVSFGLFKFQDPIVESQCLSYGQVEEGDYYYPMVPEVMPIQARIAQTSLFASTVFCIWALCLMFLEICCCRFPCSRVLINSAFYGALFGIPPTFLLYTQGYCNIFSSSSYACKLGQGAAQALTAGGFLIGSITLSCVTPKPLPIVRAVQERERQMVQDPCCCCPGKTKRDVYEVNPKLLLATLPQDHVEIVGKGAGAVYTLKHYCDDQAGGVTLQSQYNAAGDRWLLCERNYVEALDRFKRECAEMELDWRHAAARPLAVVTDPELVRQRIVLETLKNSCNQARRVMDMIEVDLEEHIKPADEKIEAALKEIKQRDEMEEGLTPTAGSSSYTEQFKSEEPEKEAAPDKCSQSPITPTYAAKICNASVGSSSFYEDEVAFDGNGFKSARMVIDEADDDEEHGQTFSGADSKGMNVAKDGSKGTWIATLFPSTGEEKLKKVT